MLVNLLFGSAGLVFIWHLQLAPLLIDRHGRDDADDPAAQRAGDAPRGSRSPRGR
ncbi:hypothetical protein NE236_26100 [Actinoallomurus purpureus]|uniref:hypothetical protein n=1 Tax=Actinoallomurus purpureus TaxID=478114 RepID=UPI0020923BB4|nr:hypothetical protein [Actinoallomurus purpureus]MCO6008454.1 hypothetical protein [Actinoallomurus purpureus]